MHIKITYLHGKLEQLQLLICRRAQVLDGLSRILRYGVHDDLLSVGALYYLAGLDHLHLAAGRRDGLDDGHVSATTGARAHVRTTDLLLLLLLVHGAATGTPGSQGGGASVKQRPVVRGNAARRPDDVVPRDGGRADVRGPRFASANFQKKNLTYCPARIRNVDIGPATISDDWPRSRSSNETATQRRTVTAERE